MKAPTGSRQQELSSRRVLIPLKTEVVPVMCNWIGESIKPCIVWPTWATVEGTESTILEFCTLDTTSPFGRRWLQ